jgi:hypothetical protein
MMSLRSMLATQQGKRFCVAFAATTVILVMLFATPSFAWASIADDINEWLCGILRDCCNWMFEKQVAMLSGIGYDGVLGAGFESMIGSSGTTSMYSLVRSVWQVAILPIGCGVLSFVFTIRLIQISQRMDGNAQMPGVKEVVFLLVFFAVFLFLIQNSFDIMAGLYEVTRKAINAITGMYGTGGTIDLAAVSIVTTEDDVAALMAMLVVSLISWLVVLVAYVVALVVSWARAIQLYLMAAFSPIPLSLMGTEETRQIGIGYIKNFIAVCLAGVIILVLLISFPIVLGGLQAVDAGTGSAVIDGVAGGLTYALKYLAMCILLILSLVKSGAWARDIVGS